MCSFDRYVYHILYFRIFPDVSLRIRPLKVIVGGMLLLYRICSEAIPSYTVLTGRIVTVWTNRHASRTFGIAMDSVLGPYDRGTWLLLLSLILMFAIACVLTKYCSVKGSSLKSMYTTILAAWLVETRGLATWWSLGSSVLFRCSLLLKSYDSPAFIESSSLRYGYKRVRSIKLLVTYPHRDTWSASNAIVKYSFKLDRNC